MDTGYINVYMFNCFISSWLIVKYLLHILFYKYYILTYYLIFKELMYKVDHLVKITIL